MKCPYCNRPDTKVIDSRPTEEGHAIRRRREAAITAAADLPPMKRWRKLS